MNLWVLTEEKPKRSVLYQIISLYCKDFQASVSGEVTDVKVLPVMKTLKFSFTYLVKGLEVSGIKNIFVKTVSGNTSFVDFLVFRQSEEPNEDLFDTPIMAIEETKTSDIESRNTGVSQRVTKFVYIDNFYRDVKKYMLYNEEHEEDIFKRPSDTNIIGTNILMTLGVEIVGKKNLSWFKKYKTIDEIIDAKNSQRQPPAGNVPIRIDRKGDTIEISGRLSKPKEAGNIGHDPNIGTFSMLSKGLRALGWTGRIVITKHGVKQSYINKSGVNNKFLFICKMLNLELKDIVLPAEINFPKTYWHYEQSSEKVASILLHILSENNGMIEVYQNHAGCERGYFFTKERDPIALHKKASDGTNLLLPDVVMYDIDENMVLLVEGKRLSTLQDGVREIQGYYAIENEWIEKYYPGSTIYDCISIFGGTEKDVPHPDVLLYVSEKGDIRINSGAPKAAIDALSLTEDVSCVNYEVIDF